MEGHDPCEHVDKRQEAAKAARCRVHRIRKAQPRVVVPVIGGVCYGCFISIPTAVSSDALRNDEITNCENCGRFLYVVGPT